MTSLLQHFKDVFNQLGVARLHLLDEVYAEDVTFIDPVHELKGLPALRDYYRRLYEGVISCRFDFDDEIVQDGRAALIWTMRFEHARFRKAGVMTLTGASHLRFSDRIDYHRDYFDMGAFIYERVPLLSSVIRTIKRRL